MSKFTSSIPVQTQCTDKQGNLILSWRKWFKDIGDDWISANNCVIAQPNTSTVGFNYLVSNGITFFTFSGAVEVENHIRLPFTVLVDSMYTQNIEGDAVPLTLCKLATGATELVVPVGNIMISGWYFNKLSGR